MGKRESRQMWVLDSQHMPVLATGYRGGLKNRDYWWFPDPRVERSVRETATFTDETTARRAALDTLFAESRSIGVRIDKLLYRRIAERETVRGNIG